MFSCAGKTCRQCLDDCDRVMKRRKPRIRTKVLERSYLPMSKRNAMKICSFWMRSLCSGNRSYGHLVDIVMQYHDVGLPFVGCDLLDKMGMDLNQNLAKFMKKLPLKAKGHIWGHAAKVKSQGTSTILDSTESIKHI